MSTRYRRSIASYLALLLPLLAACGGSSPTAPRVASRLDSAIAGTSRQHWYQLVDRADMASVKFNYLVSLNDAGMSGSYLELHIDSAAGIGHDAMRPMQWSWSKVDYASSKTVNARIFNTYISGNRVRWEYVVRYVKSGSTQVELSGALDTANLKLRDVTLSFKVDDSVSFATTTRRYIQRYGYHLDSVQLVITPHAQLAFTLDAQNFFQQASNVSGESSVRNWDRSGRVLYVTQWTYEGLVEPDAGHESAKGISVLLMF